VKIVDTSDNPRIGRLVQMVGAISLAQTPRDMFMAFAEHYWHLRPSDYMISMSTKGLPEGQYRVTRQIDVASIRSGQTPISAADPFSKPKLIPVVSGGFLGKLIAGKRPLLLHNLNVREDPVLGDALSHLGSAIVMPLYDEGEPRYWNIAFKKEPAAFTPEDLEQSLLVANLTGGTNTRLLLVDEIRKLNAQLRHEFEEVARVQKALLPRHTPNIPGLDIATSYLPSEQAGGDYYDFFPFEDGTWGILIADVSGHGAAAATVMAMLHGILHAYNGPGKSPDAVLRYANKRLLDAAIEGSFVTAFLGVYEPDTGRVTYARSGHNPPLFKDGTTGEVVVMDGAGSLPLGVFEPYEISMACIQLKPMDTIVLYTDGITEAMNAARDMFGTERLEQSLTQCSGAPDCVVDSVHGALFRHTGSMSRKDDQTLVAFRYRGA
jgi:sigma-B regulation protein RsbU (phosphoserine phosphatase)